MAESQTRPANLLKAALEATGGAGFEGLFFASRPYMRDKETPPWRQRPWVLRDSKVKPARLFKAFIVALSVISLEWAHYGLKFSSDENAAENRAFLERNSKEFASKSGDDSLGHFFGKEQSAAAGLLVASLPRSKARVLSLLCFTRDEIMLLHVPQTFRLKYFANVVEIGWRIDRNKLEWTRTSSRKGTPYIQYGFTDGSWMTFVTTPVDGQPAFTDLLPHTLTREDPIPPHPDYPAPEPKK
ncbi:hypothetical protein QIS99_18690 [Streptomyces sp. B-S-A8]|uniref:Uncharacterized protein n=1 Tax=Streptomyces solicavernae TaxID=3043614 RepID=A0ABT6RUV1_9ACTN|nr:hypothetical protein [Streptomyces sp. B-S-A8]MDI3388216.1 hypothetical protein [Streptomyces sp. B-S-A8]